MFRKGIRSVTTGIGVNPAFCGFAFELRPSDFFRISTFGFRTSSVWAAKKVRTDLAPAVTDPSPELKQPSILQLSNRRNEGARAGFRERRVRGFEATAN